MHFFNTGHTEMSRSDVYVDKGIAGIIPATRFWKRNMGIPAISRISHSLVVFLSHVMFFVVQGSESIYFYRVAS